MPTILISGGTGMIGTRLTQLLIDKGYEVIILTRDPQKHREQNLVRISYAAWDVKKQYIDPEAIKKADHIIHLAGEGIADKRWSEKRKQEIVDSRTKSSELLVKALRETVNHVSSVTSASAIGWYGPDTITSNDNGFREEAPANKDFLGETCRLWEASIQPVEELGKRLVKLRIGIVLSNKGGALAEFKKPLKGYVAAVLGDGQQVISWIHIDDLCRLYMESIENNNLHGSYNAVTPYPVTNEHLTLALAKEMRGNFYITVHVPAFVLKTMLGEMSIEVLKSTTVSSHKMQTAGFSFLYPAVEEALEQLILSA